MNTITVSGVIDAAPIPENECYGEKFYRCFLCSSRMSGVVDTIKLLVPEVFLNLVDAGKEVKIIGEIRTRNIASENGRKLDVYVFVKDAMPIGCEDENRVEIEGFICKSPVYRRTPLGREVADVLIASNRKYGKSDYIPCICWGRAALFADSIPVGTAVKAVGRLQSRIYIKRLPDGTEEEREAYEVSLSTIQVIDTEGEAECQD